MRIVCRNPYCEALRSVPVPAGACSCGDVGWRLPTEAPRDRTNLDHEAAILADCLGDVDPVMAGVVTGAARLLYASGILDAGEPLWALITFLDVVDGSRELDHEETA